MRMRLGPNTDRTGYRLTLYDGYAIKDALKAQGWRFDSASKCWYTDLSRQAVETQGESALLDWIVQQIKLVVDARASVYQPTSDWVGVDWVQLDDQLAQWLNSQGVDLSTLCPDEVGDSYRRVMTKGLYAEYRKEGAR